MKHCLRVIHYSHGDDLLDGYWLVLIIELMWLIAV
jgi:hypothetical protein